MDRWLDTKEDDGLISLDLEPNKKPASKKDTGTRSLKAVCTSDGAFPLLIDSTKPMNDPNKSEFSEM